MAAALVVHEHPSKLYQSLHKHHDGGRHSEPHRDRFDLTLGDVTHLLSRVGTCSTTPERKASQDRSVIQLCDSSVRESPRP